MFFVMQPWEACDVIYKQKSCYSQGWISYWVIAKISGEDFGEALEREGFLHCVAKNREDASHYYPAQLGLINSDANLTTIITAMTFRERERFA